MSSCTTIVKTLSKAATYSKHKAHAANNKGTWTVAKRFENPTIDICKIVFKEKYDVLLFAFLTKLDFDWATVENLSPEGQTGKDI